MWNARNGITRMLRGLALAAACVPLAAQAFESGSTGADGAFNPTVNTVLQVPPDGIFNFTSVNIPAGVTVGFRKNITNTPVTILASGDVVVAGTLHVNGGWSHPVGAAGDGNIGDDGLPGAPGPGGYGGGQGAAPGQAYAGSGHGPGGGGRGAPWSGCSTSGTGGGGGGFGSGGSNPVYCWSCSGLGGSTYGSQLLLPLVGGSGGGGGSGGSQFHGSGGGGGGGALLIAASGTVRITGNVLADGGRGGAAAGANVGATGGGGSGGAIRVVATRIEGNGGIYARGGGAQHSHPDRYCRGGHGGNGRIRLEAEIMNRTSATNPAYSFGEPSTVFVAGLPTLRITSVAGQSAPAEPSGNSDIVLPSDTSNPVVVAFETTGVPEGNTVKLRVTPASGTPVNVVSPALTGSTEKATASVSVDLPKGPSVLLAQTTYTIIASKGDALAHYAGGERVEKVRVAADLQGGSTITLITVSGKEYTLPSSRIPAMPTAG